MATYIALMNFTDKGAQSIKDTTKRAAAAKEAAKKFGVNMRETFWTMGEYDVVSILEADDGASVAAFLMSTATAGNVRSHTLRALSASEVDTVLSKIR